MPLSTPSIFRTSAPSGVVMFVAATAAVLACSPGAGPEASTPSLPFTPVQPDLFAVPYSFANAWGDFDNDGDLDLAVSLGNGRVLLYRNEGGGFVEVGAAMGMPGEGNPQLRGLSWGDYDGDGFIDLMGGAFADDAWTVVFRNEGGTRFTEVAADLGLTIPGRSSRQTNWVDFDNDGRLDVYATNRTGPNSLWRNEGGVFTRVVGGPDDPRPTVGACWFDMDGDGDLDLFLANQAGTADALWRNDGASFTDVAPALGTTGPARTTADGGVGCAIGDYDNDGHLDVFVANYGRNQLYRNLGDGTFIEVAASLGLDVENHAVGADWGDFDNDGDLDLFIAAYVGSTPDQQPMNMLFRNDGPRGFTNILAPDSPLNVADHSVLFIDFDTDGGLDLSVTDGYGPEGGHFLFRNVLPEGVKERSLSVLVLDAEGRHTRAGAEVRLYDESGRILATRQVHTGGGYNTQVAAPVHFGLRSLDPVRVEVTFMSRSGRKVLGVGPVNPSDYRGRSLVVREPS